MPFQIMHCLGKRVPAWLIFLVLCAAAQAQEYPVIVASGHGPNTIAQQKKPYVILVSLDGFRYDYAQKYGARNLQGVATRGANAPEGMIPSYPSVTFPNHYTMVTGLYPEHHGIVANNFYDPGRQARYAYNNFATSSDGSWYGGAPLWSLAEQQGMRTACLFWPGSEAEIAGQRPSYYMHFDYGYPDEERVDQVLKWLKLPAGQRPHFITLYFSAVDSAGHNFGPDSEETAKAVRHVDEMIGRLLTGVKTLPLKVDVFIVSDHGMEAEQGDWINLEQYADLSGFKAEGSLLYPPSEDAAAKAFQQLQGKSGQFVVYRRRDMPANLHYDSNPRAGDPIVVATGPYDIRARAPAETGAPHTRYKGEHGYDPHKMKTMLAIFYAEGPDIRPGTRVAPFENIHLFPLLTHILGLQTGPVDGRLGVLRSILQRPAPKAAQAPSRMRKNVEVNLPAKEMPGL